MDKHCLEVQEHLSTWLDGELAPEVLAQVERHLEDCAGCRRELARLEALEQALAGLSAPVPEGLPEKVLARLPRPRWRWWQNLALAASLALGIYLGGTLARNFYSPLQPANGFSQEVANLEAFQDFPQGSMGMILSSYQEDEGYGSGR